MISKQIIRQFLSQRMNSFLWMKKLREEDLLAEFKTYKVRPQFKTDPWLHQMVCFHIAECYRDFLFLLDLGTGKTKLILDIITQKQREKKLKRALAITKGQLGIWSWGKAVNDHSNLEAVLATGSIEEKFEKLIAPRGDVTVIDYPGLHLALCSRKTNTKGKTVLVPDEKKIALVKNKYNLLNIDELHMAQNADTLRFQLIDSLADVMDFRYGMTGTPIGRYPADVWGQFYLIDRGNTFSAEQGLFREAFFTEKPDVWKGRVWEFDRSKRKLFYQFMQNKSIWYSENECGDIPACNTIPVPLDFTPEQREHYLHAVEGLVNAGGKFTETDNSYHRMRQIVAGYLHWKDEYGEHTIHLDENPKLDMLQSYLEDSGDAKFVVSHEYNESGRMITKRLEKLGIGHEWIWGGSRDPIAAASRFIEDPKKRVLVMNSEAGGTGTDGLQKVARYLIFYESPASPRTRQQVIKRVHRTGQRHRTFIYDLIIQTSIDVRVLDFIAEGRDLHAELVEGKFEPKKSLILRA